MDTASRAPVGHSCLDRRRAAYPVAGRARDPNLALAHVCSAVRVRSRACREAPGACDAAFPRHPPGLPCRPGRPGCAALSDCEHGDRAGDLALRLCAFFADAGQEWSAHAPGTDLAINWPLAESDCFGPRPGCRRY